MKERELADFERALYMLDDRLATVGKKIVIHAIGGFVMLYRGIHEHGYTMDVDSLTDDYDDEVIKEIKEVGKALKIDNDWLNNDCAMLEGFIDDLSHDIRWEKTSYKFKSIDLYVADQMGMIRSKSKAIHDGGLVPRKTDKKDLCLLLKAININTIEELNNDYRLSFIKEKYNRAYTYLTEMGRW